MSKFIKSILMDLATLAAIITIGCGIVAVTTSPVAAQTPNPNVPAVCDGITATGGSCGSGSTDMNALIKNIINIFSWIVGIAAVIMVIWGGFSFITSSGDPQKAAKARNTILYALIGLVIVVMAQLIVRFVVGLFTIGPKATP